MNITYTPMNAVNYVHFSMGGTCTGDEEHNEWFALVVNGATVKTFFTTGASLWNTFQTGFSYPINVSVGSSTNVTIQWAIDGSEGYTIYNYCASQQNANRTLIINDQP